MVSGSVVCFTISGGGKTPQILVEINGVAVSGTSVTINNDGAEEGSRIVCVRIPTGAAGGTIDVTVLDEGEFESHGFPII